MRRPGSPAGRRPAPASGPAAGPRSARPFGGPTGEDPLLLMLTSQERLARITRWVNSVQKLSAILATSASRFRASSTLVDSATYSLHGRARRVGLAPGQPDRRGRPHRRGRMGVGSNRRCWQLCWGVWTPCGLGGSSSAEGAGPPGHCRATSVAEGLRWRSPPPPAWPRRRRRVPPLRSPPPARVPRRAGRARRARSRRACRPPPRSGTGSTGPPAGW